MAKSPKFDVHQAVTDQIIAAIEAGAGDWQMPWHAAGQGLNRPVNIDSGNFYQGINIISLWASAQMRGYCTGTWGTYRQWQKHGCQVRKGEKASLIVFYKELEVDRDDHDAGDGETDKIRFARASWVFNADQVDGYEQPPLPQAEHPAECIEAAERFVAATGATIEHGGSLACYYPSSDCIQMPGRERFLGSSTSSATETYYATLLHELTHWTGHRSRCDRDFAERFKRDAYAMEELVAELGAAFLCTELAITSELRPDHAQYIDHWLRVLKADKKAIFTASSHASQAAGYLHGLQPAAP